MSISIFQYKSGLEVYHYLALAWFSMLVSTKKNDHVEKNKVIIDIKSVNVYNKKCFVQRTSFTFSLIRFQNLKVK